MALQLILVFSLIVTIESTPVMTKESLAKQKSHMEYCSHVLNFNNLYYSLEEQKNITGIPADMSVHWKTEKLYFTLISDDMRMKLQIMQIESYDSDVDTIKVAGLGQSAAVDNLNDIVYLATDNGVYKYREDGTIDLFTASGEDVMYLTVSNDGATMYIATWPQNRVYRITNEGQRQEPFPVIPNGHGLTMDPRNNIYFIATKTTYVLKGADENGIPIKIKGLPSDKMTGIFVSRSDEVYAMDESSNLYSVDTESASAKRLGSFKVEGVNTFGMDASDNVLIGVRGAILKFKALDKDPCGDLYNNLFMNSDPEKMFPSNKNNKGSYKPVRKGKRHNEKRSKKRRHKKIPTTSTSTVSPSAEASEEEED